MRRLTLLALIVAVALGVSGAASPSGPAKARWVITDLGTLGGPQSEAVAINERGQAVGWADTGKKDENGVPIGHAFLWQNGKMTDLGSPLGGRRSAATALNERGQVVGWANNGLDWGGFPNCDAFLWQNGRMTDLRPPSVADRGAVAVNERGQVVGFADGLYPGSQPFLWQNGKMRGLGEGWGAVGNGQTSASVINERGQVVGIARAATPLWHAVLWQDGRTIDLHIAPASLSSSAAAINDRGQIVGTRRGLLRQVFLWKAGRRTDLPVFAAHTATPETLFAQDFSILALNERGNVAGTTGYLKHAFVWKDGKVRVLGTLGGRYSISAGISESGQVIGQSPTADGVVHAFVWANGHMSELSTLPGGTSSQSRAINNHNQIVGWATTKNGQRHAVLWTLRSGG